MKKGFTLIELLAVIVILAIIALIATPIVLNIINETKESAVLRSADFYIDALENEIMLENMNQGGSFNPNTCKITNGIVSCDDKEINLEVDGEVPSNGSITFEDGKVTSVSLTYTNGTVTLNNKGELVLGKTTIKTLKDLAVVSNNLGVASVHSCASSGICEPGTVFALKVNDEDTHKFYVLSDDEKTVTLIMSSYLFESEWNVSEEKIDGPLTALEELKNQTQDWENIEEYSYTLDYGKGTYSGEYVQNIRARMPSKEDVETECYINNNTCPAWISSIGYYWLSDAGSDSAYWFMDGEIADYAIDCGLCDLLGIVPVITITK